MVVVAEAVVEGSVPLGTVFKAVDVCVIDIEVMDDVDVVVVGFIFSPYKKSCKG
jgi:hypothetical protein